MPSVSKKQQRFFGLVRAVQRGDKPAGEVSSALSKVAKSISAKDASDFASSVAETKTKQVVLNILKDCREPMYLEEEETNPVAKKFTVQQPFERYVKRYIGQPFSPKELEALDSYTEQKPTKIERTEIRYETTDDFQNSTTTIIKKMKDGVEFSYNAFSKYTKVEPKEEEPPPGEEPPIGEPESTDSEPGGKINLPPMEESDTTPPNKPVATPPPTEDESDDVTITKSILFKDDIKGAAILAEFLKKLDL